MTVLCDRQIEELISIEPFQKNATRSGTISYGVSSYGYDVRVGTKFKIFTNATSGGIARCGLIVNVTPLEPQWRGKITLEISNTTPLPAKIYVNEGIAQLIFLEASEVCDVSYADKKGKYQDQEGLTLPMVDS